MDLDIDYHYDLFSLPNRNDNSHLFQRSNSFSKISNNNWSFPNEDTDVKYVMESNSNFNQTLDNGSCHGGGGGLHKTWSTPYLNNNEESKEFDEKSNEEYLNLLNMTNQWPSSSISSVACNNTTAYSSNSNSLLKDAINNNIEKSWLMKKGLSKKKIKLESLELDGNNGNERIQNNLKTNQKENAFCSDEKEYSFLNSGIHELKNVRERKNSNSGLPTFLLSTNLESLSPITISLTDLSFGGNSVSPSFPSDKLVYLDSPIRITIMGSHQVGKSALAVRYLSRQESFSRSSAASSLRGMKKIKVQIITFLPVNEYKPQKSKFARLRLWPW